MNPIPSRIFIEPPIYRQEKDLPSGRRTTLPALCKRVGIACRFSGPQKRILLFPGSQQIRTLTVDGVGVPDGLDLAGPVAALRALEALAYSFLSHGARACVANQGLFSPPIPVSRTLGKKIRDARTQAGLTQGALAARAGIHRITLSRLENDHGGTTLDTLRRIARATGLKARDLTPDPE